MMSVPFQREPDGFWQAQPAVCADGWCVKLFVAFIAAVLFIAVIVALAVGARAADDHWTVGGDLAFRSCGAASCICVTGGICIPAPLTAGQLESREHRTRCLPVGSDQIVDCWVEDKPAK